MSVKMEEKRWKHGIRVNKRRAKECSARKVLVMSENSNGTFQHGNIECLALFPTTALIPKMTI